MIMRRPPFPRYHIMWLGFYSLSQLWMTGSSFSIPPLASRQTRKIFHFAVQPIRTQLSSTLSDDDDTSSSLQSPPQKVIEIETLTFSQLVELIELSFLQSCVAMSQGDMGPLKLFIVAVKTAAQQSPSASKLIQAVNDCPTLGRSLDVQERELRSTWIQAIYQALHHCLDMAVHDLDETVVQTYSSSILEELVAIQKSGLGLNAAQFVANRQDTLLIPQKANNPLLLLEDESDDGAGDSIQRAIVIQTIKVLYQTLDIILQEEEQQQNQQSIEVDDGKQEPSTTTRTAKKESKRNNSSGGGGGRGFG